MELASVEVKRPEGANVIIGQTHFIKSVEDLYETLAEAVPGIRFGLAFAEASGPCLVRHTGTDNELESLATENVRAIGAGHVFVIILGNAYPVNVLGRIKAVSEVCTVFCASANPLRAIVARDGGGAGVLGVIDGESPRGVEGEAEQAERRAMLRRFGYKQ
jgi:adenosine/AMP kinase